MTNTSEDRLKEVAALTKAIESVFRKLIRFLVGRISLVKLQEMISYIYVDEIEIKLKAKSPGKNIALTKIALLTGLDTRTVAGIRKKIYSKGHMYKEQFLRDLTPETAIVEAWASRVAQAKGKAKTQARVLTYGRDESEFEQLFRATIKSRGITTQSILERLIATQSVVKHKKARKIELVVDKFSPYLSGDEENMVNAALSAISNLISTIEHNVSVPANEKFFQRQIWTFRLKPEQRSHFRQMLRKFLEMTERRAQTLIEPWESQDYEDDFMAIGVGLYYFEETRQNHV